VPLSKYKKENQKEKRRKKTAKYKILDKNQMENASDIVRCSTE